MEPIEYDRLVGEKGMVTLVQNILERLDILEKNLVNGRRWYFEEITDNQAQYCSRLYDAMVALNAGDITTGEFFLHADDAGQTFSKQSKDMLEASKQQLLKDSDDVMELFR